MLFESAEITDLPELAADALIAVEQKCDGVRLLTEITRDGVTFFGGGGEPVRFPAATQWFERLARRLMLPRPPSADMAVTLDGELMIDDGTYVVFDVPYLRIAGVPLSSPGITPFSVRRDLLEQLAAADDWRPGFRPVAHARTPEDKIALVTRVGEELGGEGFMLKHLDGLYQPGVRVAHSLKCKFVYTADVVVTSWERGAGTGSARLAVFDDDGELVHVGGCSLIGKPAVEDGDVIEVAYAHFRGAMIQPRMIRRRDDKRAGECTTAQFRPYSKALA
jgi:ATP-dependent DNA ligase